MNKEMLKNLTRKELFVYAAEANSTHDQELVDMITDEFKRRNNKEKLLNNKMNDKKTKEILEQFSNFTDGVRMIMLTQRGKDGGKVTNPDKVSKRKIVCGKEEFNKVFNEFLEIKQNSQLPLRIYSCVNRRDIEKGIREFKRTQLEADYYDQESKNMFYFDIKNRFMSAIMKPSSRAETLFLIDIDNIIQHSTDELHIELVEKHLKEIGVEIVMKYQTKNGVHVITKPFNPNLFNSEFGEIKKDALLLLDF